MEYKGKVIIAAAIASLVAISVVFSARYRRRRKSNQPSCYLHSDQKPQYSFKRVLTDNSFSQFKHLKLDDSNNENCSNVHPYEKEIMSLIENPPTGFEFDISNNLKMSDCYVWIDTESHLKELVDVLGKKRAFAVDTEQHSLRSFLGFTALIQISTQEEDYLIDTIALHDKMFMLGPIFADPSICKVFHGADNDVLWLQRDFHIYVVNLFDTAKACEVLSKPRKSLAFLLETYCGVSTNKLLQREDWRQRPLSAEMLQYARTDAHYLLYIAGCLIADLQKGENDNSSCPNDTFRFVIEASRRSNMICLQLYSKDTEVHPVEAAASSIFSHILNGPGGSSILPETQDLVRRVCTWRDLMARVHDESLRFVLSDQAIVSLADKVPTTLEEICNTIAQADLNLDPGSFLPVSPVVCSHLDDLYYLIQDEKCNLDDIFRDLLKKCLGLNGSCPLSVYNYALLANHDVRLTNIFVSKQNGIKNSKQIAKKTSRELFVQKFSCKSPVYHNCRIYANDGRLLCYCDRRKLEWYLRRDLAKLLDENPPAIMLLFEPKGRPEDEDNNFYVQSKKNICVGCGEGGHYLRYRIIPSCYRIHFPEHLKSHRSHDIVLVCVDCHEVAHAAAEKYKRQVAAEFGIPLFVRKVIDSTEVPVIPGPSSSTMNIEAGVSPLELRTAAMALLRHGARMPPKRRDELMQIVKRYYGGREISEEDLERALIVGMSPHERRRFEKKNGLLSKQKQATGSIFPNKKQTNFAKSAVENELKADTVDGTQNIEAKTTGIKNDQECLMVADTDISSPYSDLRFHGEVFATESEDLILDEIELSDITKDIVEHADDGGKSSPSGTIDLPHLGSDGSDLPKHNSKLSLLGHGPHGKQVVDHIMKEDGEDGIRQFCQRWRQVFVEAIHPRCLPDGWDVMHSGRREFGEFSVYNPAKNAAATRS